MDINELREKSNKRASELQVIADSVQAGKLERSIKKLQTKIIVSCHTAAENGLHSTKVYLNDFCIQSKADVIQSAVNVGFAATTEIEYVYVSCTCHGGYACECEDHHLLLSWAQVKKYNE